MIDVPLETGAEARKPLCYPNDLLGVFQQMKNNRNVLRNRARKELYQMSMEWDPMIKQFYAGLLNICYNFSKTLGTWELAEGAQLDKHNGKDGTLGIRVIMMMDPMGKAYYWLIHRKTNDRRTHFGYGFYDHRRREQAILVHHAVLRRFLRAASAAHRDLKPLYSIVTTLRDIANAFPSISHESMNETLKNTTDDWNRCQLKARHEQL